MKRRNKPWCKGDWGQGARGPGGQGARGPGGPGARAVIVSGPD